MAIEHGTKIASTSFFDRVGYSWMEYRPDFCLWAMAELDEPLKDRCVIKALSHLIMLVPILSANIKFGLWRGTWVFRDPGDISRLVSRKKANTLAEYEQMRQSIPTQAIDAHKPPLIRIIMIDGPQKHSLVIQIHHMIMDGEAVKRVLDLFATCYREVDRNFEWQPGSQKNMNRSWWQFMPYIRWWKILQAPLIFHIKLVVFLWLQLCGKITNLLKGDRSGPFSQTRPKQPMFKTICIDADAVTQVQSACQSIKATVNDTIMSAHAATLNQWNLARKEDFKRLIIYYTANLRRWWGEPDGTFANLSAIKWVVEHGKNLIDLKMALSLIKSKLDKEKRHMAIDDIWAAMTAGGLPECLTKPIGLMFDNILSKALNNGHCITNIGIIAKSAGNFGHVQAKTYSLMAPVGSARGCVLTLTGYQGALTIHFGFDADSMDPDSAQAYLQNLKDNYLSLQAILK